MSNERKKLVAGNWKMNGKRDEASRLAREIVAGAASLAAELLVCPPFPLLGVAAAALEGSCVGLGAQDCHAKANGAFTGDIAPEMLAEAGCRYVIVGHSERRQYHGENDALVAAKARGAWRAGLKPIICIGETEAERDGGKTRARLMSQLSGSVPDEADPNRTVIAYEPVWAIGTGRTPTADQVADLHGFMRHFLKARFGAKADGFRLLYGGSVKADNASALMRLPDVDGALVGGASLKSADFLAIARAC
ncbi:MAG: triose-phosphate isomerase [Alphaproteobacteria bacterium]|nr:triose-phosphate isomerase [Alphaproteobacteria bacterium]